ncbi:MAG TPA: hypothetical protein VH518_03335 [Tepidisphaeraceae bacterium]|jgi:hypothetical protein
MTALPNCFHPSLYMVLLIAMVVPTSGRCAAADTSPPATQPAGKLRIGVYDTRAICIASRNSPAFSEPIKQLQQELKDAQAAKDDQRVQAIKQRGATLQTLRHMQGFSNAPVDDIIAYIKDKLPAIARDANVSAIVPNRLDFQSGDVEVVDVTDQMVKAFNPDAKTLKTVEELRKQKAMDPLDVLQMKD